MALISKKTKDLRTIVNCIRCDWEGPLSEAEQGSLDHTSDWFYLCPVCECPLEEESFD